MLNRRCMLYACVSALMLSHCTPPIPCFIGSHAIRSSIGLRELTEWALSLPASALRSTAFPLLLGAVRTVSSPPPRRHTVSTAFWPCLLHPLPWGQETLSGNAGSSPGSARPQPLQVCAAKEIDRYDVISHPAASCTMSNKPQIEGRMRIHMTAVHSIDCGIIRPVALQ